MIEEYGSGINGIVIVSNLMERRSCVAKPILRQKTSWLSRSKVLMVLAILSLVSTTVRAGEKTIVNFLNTPVKQGGSITYSIMGDVDLLLSFMGTPTTDKPTNLEFYVTHFAGDQGDNLTVTPYIVELPDLKPEDQYLKFPLKKAFMTLKLKVPELPTSGKYRGSLIISAEGQEPQVLHIVLTRPTSQRLAQLRVDTKSNLISYTKSLVRCIWTKEPPSFTVFVRNTSSEWQARDVFLRVLEVTTPEGTNFDPRKNLTLTWNGQKADGLWRSPSPDETEALRYVISPNHQAEIGGEFHDLRPGEYTLKLGLAATNAVPQAEDQITVKVRVRDSVVGALGVLLVAFFVSLIATKGLKALRRRIAVLKKISELRLPMLHEDTAPNISVRAILKQAKDRNKSWYTALFAPDVVSGRIDKAERMVKILRRVNQIRKKINDSALAIMIRYRVEKHLTEITADMRPETMNENVATEIERKLDELEKWITTDKLCDLYWPDVKSRIANLLCQLKLNEFPVQGNRDVVDKLTQKINKSLDDIKLNPDTLNLTTASEIDEDYARLKVLWECKQNDDNDAVDSLVALFNANQSPGIIGFFKEIDNRAWEKIKLASEQPGKEWLEFTSPQKNTVYPIQAYELIQFKVESIPRSLGNNYLFRNELEYRWSLVLETKTWAWWWPWKENTLKKTTLTARTTEPRLVQYMPRKGNLTVSVQLCHKNNKNNDCMTKLVTMKEPLQIDESKDFQWIRGFRFVEVVALTIAMLFALISGLQIYYFGKPSFGSMVDYVTLFVWGASIDQGKNFIQYLAQSSNAQGSSS